MKAVNFGALPNTTGKQLSLSSLAPTHVVKLNMELSNGALLSTGYNKLRDISTSSGIWFDNTLDICRVVTEMNFSSLTGVIIIEYTKD